MDSAEEQEQRGGHSGTRPGFGVGARAKDSGTGKVGDKVLVLAEEDLAEVGCSEKTEKLCVRATSVCAVKRDQTRRQLY